MASSGRQVAAGGRQVAFKWPSSGLQVAFKWPSSDPQSCRVVHFCDSAEPYKTISITALPAKRTDAVASWGHKNMETLWVFHSLMVALAVHGTEFLKILWKTVLPACHHVAIADKIQNEL